MSYKARHGAKEEVKKKQKIDDELQNLQLDRLDKRGKTVEQIKRHSLDSTIESKPIEKALYLLAKGDEIQKLSVIENLPQLMTIDTYAAFNKIMPKIQQELTKSSAEFNITTSRIFQVLISTHFRTDINITSIVLQGLDSKDPLVANAWLDTLLEVVLVLPIRMVQTEIMPLAILKGQCSQPTSARVTSCKILGKVALHQHMKPLEIKKDILPVVYSLCQDVNYTVRAAICEQLPNVAKGLGTTMVKNFLLSNLVELASDDNVNVRAIAVSSVVQVLAYLDKETKVNAMVPLIMNLFINQPKLEDASAVVLAKNISLLLGSLDNCLTTQQADSIITFYQHLAKRGLDAKDLSVYNVDTSQDVKGREYCASNFPAVMTFTMTYSPNNVNKLYEIFKSLTFDSCYIVRQTIAGVFHEVSHILGPRNNMMKTEFVRLLRDEAEEVLHNLVPNVSTSLVLFVNNGTLSLDRADQVSSEIGKALLKCFSQLLKGYNWRLTALFIKQLETLPMVFKSDQIHNEFTPQIVRSAVNGRPKPVRSQSVRTLLFFLRWNSKLIQRNWLKDHLIHELAENKCSYTRHVFIELCKHAIEIFSHKYFKETFFTPLLRLSSDKVSTVRYTTVNLFPQLRKMLEIPQDRKLLTSFEQIVIYMEKNEKDRDVLANLVQRTKEMMSPVFISSTEASDLREKTLVEEEENIAKGKIFFTVSSAVYSSNLGRVKSGKAQILGRPSRSQSLTREMPKPPPPPPTLTGVRSTSVPRTSPAGAREGDMLFLKQHFYIDAGINMPMGESTHNNDTPSSSDSINNMNEPSSSNSSDSELVLANFNYLKVENDDYSTDTTMNMTDDVKVNMRRKKSDKTKRLSHSEIPTAIYQSNNKTKRHSSVNSDISAKKTIVDKRRSLNIQPKELSKIPVILKSVEIASTKKTNENNEEETKDVKHGRSVSNLPMPVRIYRRPSK